MEPMLTMEEVQAKWPNLRVPTLRWWRHRGIGPRSAKIGRRVFYRESDVQAWLDEQFEGASGGAGAA